MRADRLLSILLLLQLYRRLTARELARRLEVCERTIHRDMEALSGAGVPVTAERGTGGGWELVEGYETRLTGLNQSEVQALFLGQPSKALQDLGLTGAAEAAQIRLLAALPALVRRDAEFVRQRILVDGAPWRATGSSEDLTHLPTLQEAIWQEHKLLLTYDKGDGRPRERLVDPLGLIAKGRTWYLIAGVAGEPRSYRVSRVKAASIAAERAERPPDFDLAAFWAISSSQFIASLPRYQATLRVMPALLPQLRWKLRFAQVEETLPPTDPDLPTTVIIRFQSEAEAAEQILALGPGAEAVDPPDLRTRVIELAAAVLAHYTQSGAPVT